MKTGGKLSRLVKRKLVKLMALIILTVISNFTGWISDSTIELVLQVIVYVVIVILIADLGGFLNKDTRQRARKQRDTDE